MNYIFINNLTTHHSKEYWVHQQKVIQNGMDKHLRWKNSWGGPKSEVVQQLRWSNSWGGPTAEVDQAEEDQAEVGQIEKYYQIPPAPK